MSDYLVKNLKQKTKMCKVYNKIGSLTEVKSYLLKNNVNDFKSLSEVINFRKNYNITREKIFINHSELVSQERFNLKDEIEQLQITIETRKKEIEQDLQLELDKKKHKLANLPPIEKNYFTSIFNYFLKIILKLSIQNKEKNFKYKIQDSVEDATNSLRKKVNRSQFILANFNAAVNESSLNEIKELDRKKIIIDDIENYIYGALGEQKVVRELEKLPDNYILINDYTFVLDPPIYNREKNDYINSVQIDHILIAPSGVFLIETKNWSENSINNLNLRSPVEQVRRANFVLYKILAGDLSNLKLRINHHWGERKIPLRNIIVLINHKPLEEFQFVKIVTLKELLNFVEYFTPCFSDSEIDSIATYLLSA